MTCTDCEAARVAPAYQVFNPLCIYCGARYLQLIRSKPMGRTEKIDRMKSTLALWVDFGHNEAQLRKMEAADGKPFAPIETKEKAK